MTLEKELKVYMAIAAIAEYNNTKTDAVTASKSLDGLLEDLKMRIALNDDRDAKRQIVIVRRAVSSRDSIVKNFRRFRNPRRVDIDFQAFSKFMLGKSQGQKAYVNEILEILKYEIQAINYAEQEAVNA